MNDIKSSRFQPMDDCYLFIDMNSFFASCEQQKNPKWRNKPLVVAPYTGKTGCCIAVSREAKKLGIKTGYSVKDALDTYPQVIVVESRPDIYRAVHRQLVTLLNDFSPFVEVKSIDEMAITLTPLDRVGEGPLNLAYEIKRRLKTELGEYLTASIGIGPNVFLAKQAANYRKPDGLTRLKLEELPEFFSDVELKDLTGIASGMLAQLCFLNIKTPLELYQASPQFLRKKLGIGGDYWYLRLHGYPIEYMTNNQPKSIGHSCVLAPEARLWPVAGHVFQKLIERVGRRLRKKGLKARGITVYVSFLRHKSWSVHKATTPFQDNMYFFKEASKIWATIPKINPPLKLSITVTPLSCEPYHQLNLFKNDQKNISIAKVTDSINDRFGSWTIQPASLLNVKSSAPSRIAFGKPN